MFNVQRSISLQVLIPLIDIESFGKTAERITHVSHLAHHTAMHVVDVIIRMLLQ